SRDHRLAPPSRSELPPRVPDVEDQDVGADEQHDQSLDHRRQVAGEARIEDVRVQTARRAVQEAAEEESRDARADRGVAPEQRDRDPEEADLRCLHVEHAELEQVAEHVERTCEPRERTGDRHGLDVLAPDVDAAVGGRIRIEADRAHLVTERRSVEDEPEEDERHDRDEEAVVESLQDRVAPEDGDARALRDRPRLRCRGVVGVLQRPALSEQVLATPDRDPVEHDRRDHLVRTGGRLQEPGDARPHRTRDRRGADSQQHMRKRRPAREGDTDPVGHDQPDEVLALAADVEEAAPERERDGDSDEDQCRRREQRLAQVERAEVDRVGVPGNVEEPVEAGALPDALVRSPRVVPRRRHDDAARALGGSEPYDEVRRRLLLGRDVGGRLDLAHATACFLPPSISSPISSSPAPAACSPTIRPSYMTRMRSASDSTSSSSSETRRIAWPSSRSATSRRWTYSMAPTSSPRVGCAAMRTTGLRATSRATTTFC